jgi:hypothetical protein
MLLMVTKGFYYYKLTTNQITVKHFDTIYKILLTFKI